MRWGIPRNELLAGATLIGVGCHLKEGDVKKSAGLSLFLLACWGCATTGQQPYSQINLASRRFLSLRPIYVGMTRQEVAGVLGNQVIVGYEIHDEETGQYTPMTVKNPYRQEQVVDGDKVYEIDYYFVGINAADGQITDDELAPLVFVKDQLMGYGWDYLNKKVKK